MDWSKLGRFVVKAITRASVNQVVMNAVDYTTPIGAGRANQIISKLGGFIVGSMVADKAADYVMNEIDELLPGAKTIEATTE